MTRLFNGIVAFGSALLLAVTLIGAGFAVVAIPDAATATLSRAFSGCDQPSTPFTTDELTSMAIAGKHYTFDDNDRRHRRGQRRRRGRRARHRVDQGKRRTQLTR